jgi:ribonuclease HI
MPRVERHDENALIIYTDGSCRPKPRRGGYAFLLLTEDDAGEEKLLEYSFPGSLGSTNNEMELMAPIEALRLATSQHPPVPKDSYYKIVVYADSLLVVNGIGAAESTWPQRGWLTTENEPVLSADLWQELVRLKRKAGRVEFRHVKAHKTNPYNNKVDKLAKAAADLTLVTRRQEKMVARKTSPRRTEARVVPMRGQTETIRIVAVRAIRGQPHHAYKYEVVGDESPNYHDVDDAFAMNDRIAMRRAHIYEVRFADEEHCGRWIVEVVREIPRD